MTIERLLDPAETYRRLLNAQRDGERMPTGFIGRSDTDDDIFEGLDAGFVWVRISEQPDPYAAYYTDASVIELNAPVNLRFDVEADRWVVISLNPLGAAYAGDGSTAFPFVVPPHDHTETGQLQIPTDGLEDGAVNPTKAGIGSSEDGHVVKSGTSFSTIKYNLSATTAPTTGDDSTDGYSVGSIWIDTTNDLVYVCVDASVGAAVWLDTSTTISTPVSLANGGTGADLSGANLGDIVRTGAVMSARPNGYSLATAPTVNNDTTQGYTTLSKWVTANPVRVWMAAGVSTGAAEWRELYKDNTAATAAPTVNDDVGDSYVVGSMWIDVTNDLVYICVDNSTGAAVWRRLALRDTAERFTSLIVNEDGASTGDVRFEGDTLTHLFFTDASADNIGINNSAPSSATMVHVTPASGRSAVRYETSTPTSVNQGDWWRDAAADQFKFVTGGIQQFTSSKIWTQTANSSVSNTTTKTAFAASGVNFNVLTSGLWTVGKRFRVTASGYFSCAVNSTLDWYIQLNGADALHFGQITIINFVGSKSWFLQSDITCRSTGGSGTASVTGHVMMNDQITTGTNAGTTTVNTTTNQTQTILVQWSNADASNSITLTDWLIEVL